MGIKRSEVAFGLILGVVLTGCSTFVTGTICKEITIELCTALPYTQTSYPNSLGHVSHDHIPPHLGSIFQTLITIGCYHNVQLFLCAAAFPQCTTSGQLLPPCRSLCENAMSGCRFWFGYLDLLDNISCEAMPNSSDSSVCVGLNTSPSSVAMVTSEQSPGNIDLDLATVFESTVKTDMTNSSRAAITQNTNVYTETLFATLSPRQPMTTSSSGDKDDKSKEENGVKPAKRTLLNFDSSDFTSKVKGRGSTESKGGHKMTDAVAKSAKTDIHFQGDSSSHSTLPALGIMVSVLSCAGMVVLLISCAFFRKAFGKPFGGRRRKPRDGAFYTNPAFSDLPQSTARSTGVRNVNGESLGLHQQPYTLADLPPHPASSEARSCPHTQAEPDIYQQEPRGFTEQNLFVATHPPPDHHRNELDHRKQSDSKTEIEQPRHAESYRVTSDLVYSNKVTSVAMDTNANEHGAGISGGNENNETPTAPSRGEPYPMVSTNMDNGDVVIANPIAC